MSGIKSLFASKTIWGLLAALLGALGVSLPEGAENIIGDFAGQVMTFVGIAVAFYGRITAKKVVTLTGTGNGTRV